MNQLFSLETLIQNLNDVSPTIEGVVAKEETDRRARKLYQDSTKYKNDHSSRVEDMKTKIREDYPKQIVRSLKPHIQANIKLEVASQAKSEIDVQFKNKVSIPLEQQLKETEEQLEQARAALSNSKARINNATIEIAEPWLTEPLELVYKADGKKSEFWPADLNSLIAYSPDVLKKLLGDYQLPVDKEHRTNLNRFMGHIGIKERISFTSDGPAKAK